MKKLAVKFVIIIFILFSFTSCDEDNPIIGNEIPIDEIFPLDQNSEWIVKLTLADSTDIFVIDTNYVVKDTIINNQTWYRYEAVWGLGYDYRIFRNSEEGLLEYFEDVDTLAIRYKYPAVKGEKYSSAFNGNIEVLSISDTISVEAGTFICYHYSSTFLEVWLSPNVGFVRAEEYYIDGLTRERTMYAIVELQEYRKN